MQLILSPALRKIVPQLPTNMVVEAHSIMGAMIHLELKISQYVKKTLPIGLFTITNQLISDILNCKEETVIVKLAAISSGGKNSGYIMGAVMIIAGAALMMSPAGWAMAPQLFSIGAGLAISGALTVLQTAMFRPPTLPGLAEAPDVDGMPSYNISGFSNKIGQEYPIPLCYGKVPIAGPILDHIEEGIVQTASASSNANVLADLVTYGTGARNRYSGLNFDVYTIDAIANGLYELNIDPLSDERG